MAKIISLSQIKRPMPPEDMTGLESVFCDRPIRPAPELREWAVNTFIDPDGPLANEDHIHLVDADIGFLWAAAPNTRQMNSVVGEAEMPTFRCGKWQKARQDSRSRNGSDQFRTS